MQKHIYVELEGIEEISREDLNSLVILTDLNLDETSNLKGTVHTKNFLETLKTKLISKFPDFYINIDEPIIIDKTRKDSIEQKDTDAVLIDILYTQNLSLNDTYMTKVEAQNVSNNLIGIRGRLKSIFQDNKNITNFESFLYFTNIIELNGYCDGNTWKVGIFKGCTNLKKIELPETLITIYTTVFDNCHSLLKIDLKNVINIEDGGNWLNIGESGAFYGCISLQKVIWPNITKIGTYAFKNCSKLALNTLPPNLKTLGEGVFSGTLCNFENLPESVTTINGFPWANTTGTLTYPLYNSTIVSWGGYGELSIGTNIINDTIISDGTGIVTLNNLIIGPNAFQNNTSIIEVKGNGIIGNNACVFQGCSNLKEIPLLLLLTTTRLGDRIFNGCSGLTNTTIELPENITIIGELCFNGSNIHTLITYGKPSGTNTFSNCSIKKVIFKKPFTMEYHYLPFMNSLIREVVFAEGQDMNIGYFFLNANRLRKVNLNSVKTIYSPTGNHLANTYCLKYIEFNNLKTIGSTILNAVTGLKLIVINQDTIPTFNSTPTINTNSTLLRFYVPDNLVSSYLETLYWNAFPQRILPISLLNPKEYYGVDFFGDKYYDTKRRILQTSKFILEAEYFGGGSGRIFGISTNSQGYGEYWPRAEFNNSFSWFATYTGNISISSYIKHHIEFNKDSITVNGNTILSNRTDSYNYETTAYLGALNYNNTAISKWQGTIYKFLWYEGDTLVQAWIGNENGGFDIYADEDIEPLENDTINSLEMYAIRYLLQ